MVTLHPEVSSSFIFKVVANGLVVVVDEDMGGHCTGAPKNVAAGKQKTRNEEKRPKKRCHAVAVDVPTVHAAASSTPTQCGSSAYTTPTYSALIGIT